MIGPVYHNPARLRAVLLSTKRPVSFDTETTGLDVLRDRVLSYGFRVHNGIDWENHLLFTHRCCDATVVKHAVNDAAIAATFATLERPGLILVGFNLRYDLLMCRHEGYRYSGLVRCTQNMLRLMDQDRGYSRGDEDADGDAGPANRGRKDLAAPPDSPKWLDYRLKNVVPQLLKLRALRKPPGPMLYVGYRQHAEYLGSDIYVTQRLHDFLWAGMPPALRWHWVDVQGPLLHLLCDMQATGVVGDLDFVRTANDERAKLLDTISDEHAKLFGVSLAGITTDDLRDLLYRQHQLPRQRTAKGQSSVAAKAIARLIVDTTDERIKLSLRLVHDYLLVDSLSDKLNEQADKLYNDDRFHAQFDPRQASGRISSSGPNLQQIASDKTVLKGTTLEPVVIGNRNLVVADPGFTLVATDAAQADVRILCHEIISCEEDTTQHRHRLHSERFAKLPNSRALWEKARNFRNHSWRGTPAPEPPEFRPHAESKLFEIFDSGKDFYPLVAQTIMGNESISADERRIWKVLTLSQINGKTAKGIADELTYKWVSLGALKPATDVRVKTGR